MIRLALKIIFGNRLKFYSLVAGLTFAVLLIALLASIYNGVLQSFFNTPRAAGVPIWVMDASTQNFDRPVMMSGYALNAVRSVPGILWAEPYYTSEVNVRLDNGLRIVVSLVGVSSASRTGMPHRFLAGSSEDLRSAGAVAIDRNQLDLLQGAGIGSTFEFGEHHFEIKAIVDMKPNTFSFPVCFVSEEDFISCFPNSHQLLSYVLVAPADGVEEQLLCHRIEQRCPTLCAMRQEEFAATTMQWYKDNTSMPLMFMVVVAIGVVFSVIITAQQFYTFVLENINCIAVLKSMGFNNLNISGMLLVQMLAVGFSAYGVSLGAIALTGMAFEHYPRLFYYTPFSLLPISGGVVLLVCLLASQMGIIKMRSIEPAAVFRM